MLLELAKVGNWNGQTLTKEHLQQVVKNFKDEVPIVLGHNRADYMPAFGWIKSVHLSDDGEILYGKAELSEVLKEAYDFGLYKKWSIGLRKNEKGEWYLHHVAFLGAVPPRIKGLKILEMSELTDLETFEFAQEPKWKSFAKTGYPIAPPDTPWDPDKAKKRIVEKYGWAKLKTCVGAVDVSEEDTPEAYSKYKFPFCDIVDGEIKIVPKAVSSGIGYLNGARGVKVDPALARVVKPVFEKLHEKIQKAKEKKDFSEGGFEMTLEELKAKYEALKKEFEEAKKKAEFADALKEELEKYRKAVIEQKKETLKKAMEGKIPAEKAKLVLEFVDKLETADKKFEFSDEKKRDIFDVLTEIFSALPEIKGLDKEMEFGEPGKDDVNLAQVMLEKL
jgi:FtsZ-binding cell division protein ZapB